MATIRINSPSDYAKYQNQKKNRNTDPGYGSRPSNPTLDPTRGTVTYGGMGRNASTGNGSSTKVSTSSSSSGHSSSSENYTHYEEPEPYVEEAPASYQEYWSANDLIDDYMKYLNDQAKSAYDRNMEILNGYYDNAKQNLQNNYNESVGTLNSNNALNTNNINADAEAAMRQAYINNMLSRRNLQQVLTAQGLNGGASETTRASMENNYGNARNNIDTTRNRNLADLATQYNNNLAGLRQQLNSGLSDLDKNRLDYSLELNQQLQNKLDSYADKITSFMKDYEARYNNPELNQTSDQIMGRINDLLNFEKGIKNWGASFGEYNLPNASNLGSIPTSYINNLSKLAADSAAFNLDPAQVNNPYDPTSMQQAGQFVGSNYARYLAAQDILGNNKPTAINTQVGNNGNVSSLEQVLKALYGV